MGRRIRTLVPQTDNFLIPTWPYLEEFRKKDHTRKQNMRNHFDQHHRVQPGPKILEDTPVWISAEGRLMSGTVVTQANRPRSYVVDAPSGRIERNRHHLGYSQNKTL